MITNYERIRTMSVDEMAEFLADNAFGCNECEEAIRLCDNPLTKDENCDGDCSTHCKEWLKQSTI